MNLQSLIQKYGNKGLNKEGWFKEKEPTLDEVRRIVAKGELEEAGFRIPYELRRYLDISSEGKLIVKQEIPEELQSLADDTRAAYRRAKDAQNSNRDL